MEVQIAEERIIVLEDRFTMEIAEERAWARRSDAFGAVAKLGGLFGRTADDYECVYRERRLQPFWYVRADSVIAYERTRDYTIEVGPGVRTVETGGEQFQVEDGRFSISGFESCRDETSRSHHFDGLTRADNPSLDRYLQYSWTTTDAAGLAEAAESGTVVVPPQHRASMLVREVVSAMIGRVEADRVLEERVSVDRVDLVYRPVYAFRFRRGGKEGVLEFDGLTGDVRADGATFEQYFGKVLEPKFLLDVGVEAVNMFVPGTQLVRLVVEQGARRMGEGKRER
ncbi:hypothetical protein GCM10028820_20180 [Tessaracoccus terricola]